MSTEIQQVEAKIVRIPGATHEEAAEAIVMLEGLAQRIKQLQADALSAIEERIREHGEFRVGDNLYQLTRPKTVKDRDVAATTAKMLEVVGGDMEKFVGCLSVNAFKPGAVKRVLEEMGAPGETFDVLFSTEYEDKVKVTKVNLAFVK